MHLFKVFDSTGHPMPKQKISSASSGSKAAPSIMSPELLENILSDSPKRPNRKRGRVVSLSDSSESESDGNKSTCSLDNNGCSGNHNPGCTKNVLVKKYYKLYLLYQ